MMEKDKWFMNMEVNLYIAVHFDELLVEKRDIFIFFYPTSSYVSLLLRIQKHLKQ